MEILERLGVLLNTTDSHFGEYIHWAYESVDHQGILGSYVDYKKGDARALITLTRALSD